MLCFSIYVFSICAFRGNFLSNLLINFYDHIIWSHKVVCIVQDEFLNVSIKNPIKS